MKTTDYGRLFDTGWVEIDDQQPGAVFVLPFGQNAVAEPTAAPYLEKKYKEVLARAGVVREEDAAADK